MPRSRKPERYPPEYFQLARVAWRSNEPLAVPCDSPQEALGLRTKIYAFFAALDEVGAKSPEALASRLIAARRMAALPGESEHGWVTEAVKDLLAAAADIEVEVRGCDCVLVPKSHNRFAQRIRAALDAKQPDAQGSLERLQNALREGGGQDSGGRDER